MSLIIDDKFKVIFRGIELNCEEIGSDGNGQRTIVHQFALNQNHAVEQLGLDARKFNLTIVITGEDWREKKKQVLSALSKPGPGVMIHPEHGQITVSAEANITETENYVNDRYTCSISVTFVEWRRNKLVTNSTINSKSRLLSAADRAKLAVQQVMDAAYRIQGLPLEALQYMEEQFANTFGLFPFQVSGIVQLGADILDGSIFSTNALWQFNNMLDRVKSSVTDFIEKEDVETQELAADTATRGLIDVSRGVVEYQQKNQIAGVVDKKKLTTYSAYITALLSVPKSLAVSYQINQPFVGASDSKALLAYQSDVMAIHNRTMALITAAELTSYIEYDSKPQARTIAADLIAEMQNLANEMAVRGDDIGAKVYDALNSVIGAFLLDINSRIPSLPDTYAIVVTEPTSALILSNMAYGTTAYADEITSRNGFDPMEAMGRIEFVDHAN